MTIALTPEEELGDKLEDTRLAITACENGGRAAHLEQTSLLGQDINSSRDLDLNASENTRLSLMFHFDNFRTFEPKLHMLLVRKLHDIASVEKTMGEPSSLPPSYNLNDYNPQIVESRGREVRDWLGVEQAPLGDVLALLESKGIKILLHPFPSEISGLSAYSEEVGGIIFVNAKHPTKRKYFTALHELGHLILHRSEYGKTLSSKDKERESAANHFAGALLMPDNVLKKELLHYHQRWIPEPLLQDLKLRYQISMKMILVRATQIGLIQFAQKEQQYASLEKKYGIT